MKNFTNTLKSSLNELKSIRNISICALFIALSVLLGTLSVQVTPTIKVGFSFLCNSMIGLMFGPVTGAVFGGATDIIKYFIKPTGAFFPGFTLSAIVGGFIYGIFLYKKPVSALRCAIAKLTVVVIVNVVMNSIWLRIMYHTPWEYLLTTRIIKELIMYPIETFLFIMAVNALKAPLNKMNLAYYKPKHSKTC